MNILITQFHWLNKKSRNFLSTLHAFSVHFSYVLAIFSSYFLCQKKNNYQLKNKISKSEPPTGR